MKFCFFPISFFGDFLILTTTTALALSHPLNTLAQTKTQFAQITLQVQHHYPIEKVSPPHLAENYTDFFQRLIPGDVFEEHSDTPPPIPGTPGGSR